MAFKKYFNDIVTVVKSDQLGILTLSAFGSFCHRITA